jgi:uncharacterized protein YxeA|tara:strand:- start:88 stop:429 length:342 start_codon:yes stop_codon:yes gene_type:complete
MKKRLLLLPIFLILLAIVSAPTINYHSNDYMENKFYHHQDSNVETTRIFLISEDNGNNYYRTFKNYNKEKNYDFFKSSYQRKGIYLDFFDVDKMPHEEHCDVDCPEGWVCKKE